MGFSNSIVFRISLGGIITFQVAIDYPNMVDRLVVHKAPTISLLPNGTEVYEFLFSCHELFLSEGLAPAAAKFWTRFIGYDDEGVAKTTAPEPHNPFNFWKNQFIPITNYTPDLRKIRENGTSFAVITGIQSRHACYARTTIEHQKIFGCMRIVAPEYHQGFGVEAEEFTPVFEKLLEDIEELKIEIPKLKG